MRSNSLAFLYTVLSAIFALPAPPRPVRVDGFTGTGSLPTGRNVVSSVMLNLVLGGIDDAEEMERGDMEEDAKEEVAKEETMESTSDVFRDRRLILPAPPRPEEC